MSLLVYYEIQMSKYSDVLTGGSYMCVNNNKKNLSTSSSGALSLSNAICLGKVLTIFNTIVTQKKKKDTSKRTAAVLSEI